MRLDQSPLPLGEALRYASVVFIDEVLYRVIGYNEELQELYYVENDGSHEYRSSLSELSSIPLEIYTLAELPYYV